MDRRHIYYWIIPTAIMGLLVAMYFSGISWMGTFVAPKLNREFGALENLQHLLILGVLIMAVQGIRRKPSKLEKWACGVVALCSLFILLEEIDYGLHYISYLRGEYVKIGTFRNVHNIPGYDRLFTPVVYFILGFFFVFLPFVSHRFSNPWIRYLIPDRYSAGTLIGMIVVAQIAFFLDKIDVHSNLGLRSDISEFGEPFVYYLWFMYFRELIYKRRAPVKDEMKNEARGSRTE